MKCKSKDIISVRDNLSRDITKYWKIIKSENIMSQKAIDAHMGSGFDLKSLLNTIHQLAAKRIKVKLMIQAINLGIKGKDGYIDLSSTKDSIYESIFKLSELKEEFTQLSIIQQNHTLKHPTRSSKNLGEDGKPKLVEQLSNRILSTKKNKITLEINKLNETLAKFNDNAEIEVPDDEYKMYFAA